MRDNAPTEYKDVIDQIKKLEADKASLRKEIISYMTDANEYTHSNDTHQIKLSRRTRVKYDTDGLLELLESKNLDQELYTERKLDLKKLEVLIVEGVVSAEDIAQFATIEEQDAITVKEILP